jgi:hypothetical protein
MSGTWGHWSKDRFVPESGLYDVLKIGLREAAIAQEGVLTSLNYRSFETLIEI